MLGVDLDQRDVGVGALRARGDPCLERFQCLFLPPLFEHHAGPAGKRADVLRQHGKLALEVLEGLLVERLGDPFLLARQVIVAQGHGKGRHVKLDFG